MFTLLTKNGDFLCIYDYNHPSWKHGDSHKIYPLKPNCVEMIHMIKSANVTPTYFPHILWDENDRMFFVRYTYNDPMSMSVVISTSYHHGKSCCKMD